MKERGTKIAAGDFANLSGACDSSVVTCYTHIHHKSKKKKLHTWTVFDLGLTIEQGQAQVPVAEEDENAFPTL